MVGSFYGGAKSPNPRLWKRGYGTMRSVLMTSDGNMVRTKDNEILTAVPRKVLLPVAIRTTDGDILSGTDNYLITFKQD